VIIPSSVADRIRRLVFFAQNPVTTLGAVLTTSSAVTMIGFWIVELTQARPVHPYMGILLFLLLPGVFVLGLVLMPVGIVLRRRKIKAANALPLHYPALSLNEPTLRKLVTLVLALSFANVVILGAASYQGVGYMDSTQFCGLTCHTVMAPEYTAYMNSPHSRIACTECHIGEGAGWFVRSKLSGTRQLFAVAFKTYSRPIPSPVKHLRPARETCEQCHWPQRFVGDRLLVHVKYAEDEKNTPSTTVLSLKIGGSRLGGGVGIHGRHLDGKSRIRYVATDDRRQVIPAVTYLDDDGKAVDFVSTEVKASAEQIAAGEHREMDCIDCHNRPTHIFELPDRALDRAMSEGLISPELPFVKKKGLELLKAEYADSAAARKGILDGLVDYYRKEQPEAYSSHRALIEAAAQQMLVIYGRNVFPEMKITWGTHPNNIGHEDFLGCFRCHDDNHKSASGRTITQDCNACHTLLAVEESNPKVLADLGLQ
jgi:nitrate/TMAO reductase-like tetraheme cytochrome c subunit